LLKFINDTISVWSVGKIRSGFSTKPAPVAACLGSRHKEKHKWQKEAEMSGERSQNVQDVFLNYIRKHKTPVTVFLINGVKLQGVITWFDNFCVLLRRDGHVQLVYKHAISTVMPTGPIQLFENDAGTADDDD